MLQIAKEKAEIASKSKQREEKADAVLAAKEPRVTKKPKEITKNEGVKKGAEDTKQAETTVTMQSR